ncbi:MAG: glycine cleavage system aminomethyltransferase GcvT [Victivallaceae bacterium]|nr:glycine cleavage system aminomethyltransferase GcvT [Victivallaceae bacterium]
MATPVLQKTALFEEHIGIGAKMVPFAGWNMPVNYVDGIIAEHEHTRKSVSLFDICHMGEFRIAGKGAAAALDRILARGVLDQAVGVCRYNFLLNDEGGTIDDLVVYKMAEDDFFVVVNASGIGPDAQRFQSELPEGIGFEDLSPAIAKLDLQGPLSAEVMEKLGVEKAALPTYYHWKTFAIGGRNVIVSRTGYTGELGFELYFNVDYAPELWEMILAIDPVRPAGLGARDTLRLEMGYPLYGHELNGDVSPLEAGYGAMLHLDASPERDFCGRAAMLRKGMPTRLGAVQLSTRRQARSGTPVLDGSGRKIGTVTSGAFGPSVGSAIALVRFDGDQLPELGAAVGFDLGTVQIAGKRVETPFFHGGSARIRLNG